MCRSGGCCTAVDARGGPPSALFLSSWSPSPAAREDSSSLSVATPLSCSPSPGGGRPPKPRIETSSSSKPLFPAAAATTTIASANHQGARFPRPPTGGAKSCNTRTAPDAKGTTSNENQQQPTTKNKKLKTKKLRATTHLQSEDEEVPGTLWVNSLAGGGSGGYS